MQIIVNADDFGRSESINQAVARAHRDGVLTSASLMVGGEAFDEAVELARRMPALAVGLHVVVSDGRAVLPPAEIPHLVDASGRFGESPLQVGLRYAFNRPARVELAAEIRAQFERFAATGLHLSHVDGHQHMHLHPAVLKLVLPLAEHYGASGFRLPRDRLLTALRCDHRRLCLKTAWAIAFGLLCRRSVKQLRQSAFAVPRRVYGLMQSGHMGEAYVVSLLRQLHDTTSEIYFHPSAGPRIDALGPNPEELHTLLSPLVRSVIQSRGLCLATYQSLES